MRVEGARGGYNEVLACLGNSHHHAETLALLRRRPSAVLAHDVRLTGCIAVNVSARQLRDAGWSTTWSRSCDVHASRRTSSSWRSPRRP